MDTNSNTAAKRIITVEVSNLSTTGYGPGGVYTRKAWRNECLNQINSGKEVFLKWQMWVAGLGDVEQVNFGYLVQFDNNTYDRPENALSNRLTLDFIGQDLKDYLSVDEIDFWLDVDFSAATFHLNANFSKTKFHKNANFISTVFLGGNVNFQNAVFTKNANFINTLIIGFGYFGETIFNENANFSNTTILSEAVFSDAIFERNTSFTTAKISNANLSGAKFNGFADFDSAEFFGSAHFNRAIFKETYHHSFNRISKYEKSDNNFSFNGGVNFNDVKFNGIASFDKAKFYGAIDFRRVKFCNFTSFQEVYFAKSTNFGNAIFENLGHFELAYFQNHIPVFRGCKLDTTRLEFSDETKFVLDEIEEGSVENASFLKRLSDEHGQIDQALRFNAIELQLKRRKPSADFGFKTVTWLYEKLSDYGRSFVRPILGYIALLVISALFAMIYSTYSDSPDAEQQVLCKPIKDQPPPLKLSYERAVAEYAMFRAGGLMDFTDTGKQNNAVNCRLFEEPIEPPLMRAWGIFKGIASIALLFLAALGLRNKYRIK